MSALVVDASVAVKWVVDEEGSEAAAVLATAELEHPVYDCVYLALALERDTELVTADGRFTHALRAHGRYQETVRLLTEPPA